MNELSVGGKVDELGLVKLGVVVHQIDRWLMGRLTTLSRNGRVRGEMTASNSRAQVGMLNAEDVRVRRC
jgi:hypothetical protein